MSVCSLLQAFENKCPKRYHQYCPEIKHIDLDVVLTWYIAISVASWWTDRHNGFKKHNVPCGFTQFVFSFTCVIRILYLLDCYYSVKMLIKVTLLLMTSVQSHFIIDSRTYGKIYAIKKLKFTWESYLYIHRQTQNVICENVGYFLSAFLLHRTIELLVEDRPQYGTPDPYQTEGLGPGAYEGFSSQAWIQL